MMLSETPHFMATNSAADIVSIYESMPLLPGKVIVGLLLLLSVISWSVIACKSLFLSRVERLDLAFKRRLKRSRTCLEIYEGEEKFEPSLLFDVYQEGARSAAIEMTGSADPDFLRSKNLEHFRMNVSQLEFVDSSLEDGERRGVARLFGGFGLLKLISLVAPCLGVAGGLWILISALGAEPDSFRLLLSYALIIIALSLFVAAPAGVARVHFLNKCRHRAKGIRRFRTDVMRTFVSAFEERVSDIITAPAKPAKVELPSESVRINRAVSTVSIAEPPKAVPVPAAPAPTVLDLPDVGVSVTRPAKKVAAPMKKEGPPFDSPFTLCESMTEYEAIEEQAPKIDFKKALVPEFDEKPLHRSAPINPGNPYVSANY